MRQYLAENSMAEYIIINIIYYLGSRNDVPDINGSECMSIQSYRTCSDRVPVLVNILE